MVLVRASRDLQAESYWQELVAGLDDAISAGGGQFILKIVPDDAGEREAYAMWAAAGRIRTVIIENFRTDDTRRTQLEDLGLEAVVIGSPEEAADRPSVRTMNNEEAARVAVEALYTLGHRAIAHVPGPSHFSHSIVRTAAFAALASEFDIRVVELQGDYSRESGAAAVRSLLAGDQHVTAVVCDNDLMAVGALAEAVERGVQVPGELSIVAWDDSVRCQMSLPPLAALSHDVREVGRIAGDIAVQAHTGRTVRSDAQPPVFLARGTVSPPFSG
jgi:LacI family repressor for deo operon, udp, cdd, tsx, nupC, and nupG